MNVHRGRCQDVLDVNALVNGDRPVRGHAVRDKQLPNGLRRRNEAIHLSLFPARQRVAAEMKIDASGGDERRGATPRPLGR